MTETAGPGRNQPTVEECVALMAPPRVCPQPAAWLAIWHIVDAAGDRHGAAPRPKPLIFGAWGLTSGLMKREHFISLLQAARARGVLTPVAQVLCALAEKDWAHEQDFSQSIPASLASNGAPRPDRSARTVKITVQFREGTVMTFDGEALPKIDDGIGELSLPAFLLSESDKARYAKEEDQLLLPGRTVVRCHLSARYIPDARIANCVFHRGC